MNSQLAQHPSISSPMGLGFAVALFIIFLLAIVVLGLMVRKLFRSESKSAPAADWTNPKLDTENASAFMAASMQGVIEKLRAQEKELARLHMLAQERAQESERLTEEVTRNMPTGLLLVNATGAISSTNPAAEEALGIRPLRYRSYKEILGADSDLTQMLTATLADGKTFQRGEVEHITPQGEASPPRRDDFSDLSASSQFRTTQPGASYGRHGRQSRNESERRALPDERFDGAHRAAKADSLEGKSRGARRNVRRHRPRIQERSRDDFRLRADDSQRDAARTTFAIPPNASSIRRALSRIVVTEFLRFAKPLEICYETVPMQTLVERVIEELHEAIPQCAVEFRRHVRRAARRRSADSPGAAESGTQRRRVRARQRQSPPRVTISGSIEELGGRKWQRICVADNGPGIPQTDLPKIFLPFYTTKSEGHRSRPGRGPKSGAAARRQHRGAQPPGRRGRVPALVTFAAGAFTVSIPLGGRSHLN